MFGKKSVETLVVGAGPVGMLSALALARSGHDVAIVDSAPRTCTSSNATVLHPSTLQALERLGIADKIVKYGYKIEKMEIFDGVARKHTFDLSILSTVYPYALSVPQSELELLLEEELEQAGVHIYWNHKASEIEEEDGQLNVSIDRFSDRGTGYAVSHTERVIDKTLHFKTQTLLAADGYNSILRRIADVELQSLGADQYFAMFEFETDRDPKHVMQLSLRDGLATLQQPIDSGFARLQFQHDSIHVPSRNRNKERSCMQDIKELPDCLDAEHFNDNVRERVPWRTGYINRLRYRAITPFRKHYLTESRKGHVFFLGDSARTFGPIASMSLNLGLQEAVLVCDTILNNRKDLRKRFADLDNLSESFARSWKNIAQIEQSAFADPLADPWIAENRGRILRALPATGITLEHLAEQVHLHFQPIQLASV